MWAVAYLYEVKLGSKPIILPPSLAKLYDKNPAPQPISNTYCPFNGVIISVLGKNLRKKLIRW